MNFHKTAFQRNMAEYVSISEFVNGWTYFTKKILLTADDEELYGKFPCSDFSCTGCDDWLDCDNPNRTVKILKLCFRPFVALVSHRGFCNFQIEFVFLLERIIFIIIFIFDNKKATSNRNLGQCWVRAARPKFSRRNFMAKMSQWNMCRWIKSKRIMSSNGILMDVTNSTSRKKFFTDRTKLFWEIVDSLLSNDQSDQNSSWTVFLWVCVRITSIKIEVGIEKPLAYFFAEKVSLILCYPNSSSFIFY